ncbi:MAG: sigma 54-interacting transcriptional regulator [Sandaracinaceae bacterium]|nr:sigma 54-interacting transcriptional regulator [Sandaracinaceae bacterium]
MTDGNGGRRPADDQAFVAVRHGARSWVVDLPRGEAPFAGPDEDAVVRIEGQARAQGLVRWDGDHVTLERTAKSPPIYVNGKRLAGRAILRPGDELSVGDARMVVGLASQPHQSGRRALTHQEFRERLAEELARAARRGRPTSLVMVHAASGDGGRVIEAALAAFRAGDVLATYAHDELELLFPDTSAIDAGAVVTRVLGDAFVAAGVAAAPLDADTPERLMRAARLALGAARASGATIAGPSTRSPADVGPFVAPIARDPATLAIVERLGALAVSDTPILLTGEASSGKGVFARILHDRSPRAEGPYVVLRCASLVDQDRIAAALGPRGGVPEGATCAVLGARGGTLVLDEVCELPPDPQERLLDLLDQLDGSGTRLVATTHLDLDGLARRGAFSEPLRALLRGAVVEIPPLRERPEDIVPLAEGFAQGAGAPAPVRLSPGALARLRSHPWPGNVLELRNAMERAVRLANGGEILAEHLPSDSLPMASGEGRLREHVDSIERDAIVKALADSNHNQTHAARRLGISRRALIYKMEKYGLKAPPGTARR